MKLILDYLILAPETLSKIYKMNSLQVSCSPTYKNLKTKQIHSPVELKEKMRKDYRNKVQNCRNILLNRFRGSSVDTDLRRTLTNIYNEMFNETNKDWFKSELLTEAEETNILEEIKEELIQDELGWYMEEYEKSHLENIDWSSLQQDEDVICLICQKNNFSIQNEILSCPHCKIHIKTKKSLKDIKKCINESLEMHNSVCTNNIQLTTVSELNETHIYYLCESCMDMRLLI